MVTLSPEQAAQLLENIKHTSTYWPVLIALATGMRRGEVLALRWKNVDLDRGALRVVQSLEQTKKGLRFKDTKQVGPVPLLYQNTRLKNFIGSSANRLRNCLRWVFGKLARL